MCFAIPPFLALARKISPPNSQVRSGAIPTQVVDRQELKAHIMSAIDRFNRHAFPQTWTYRLERCA
jgi:hypothetical protein